jgi:hypothetical protein
LDTIPWVSPPSSSLGHIPFFSHLNIFPFPFVQLWPFYSIYKLILSSLSLVSILIPKSKPTHKLAPAKGRMT